jgi:hypothetical protein
MHRVKTAGLTAALTMLLSTAPTAQEFLSADRLSQELSGQTIKGYYLIDKVNFIEVYLPDGRITYKDDLKADAGRWSVQGRAFCTFYDRIAGACWYVVKISGNCFEFYQAPDDGADIDIRELRASPPHARAARDSDRVSCDEWFGS